MTKTIYCFSQEHESFGIIFFGGRTDPERCCKTILEIQKSRRPSKAALMRQRKNMKKSIKISLIATALLCIGLVIGGYIFISSKITPENLKTEIEKSLRGLLPEAEIAVGNLSYSIGLSITVKLEKLEGSFKGRPLFALKGMKIFIPLWSLLMGGGAVNISLDNPLVYYTQIGDKIDWSSALGEKAKQEEETIDGIDGKEASSKALIVTPVLMADSRSNVKLTNLSLFYSKDGQKHNILIDRLEFKDIGLNSFLSFEMDSLLNTNLNNAQKMSLRLTAIGEVRIKEFIEKSVLPVRTVITISDIKTPNRPYDIGNIENTFNIFIDKKKNIHGTSKLTYKGQNTLDFKFQGNVNGDFVVEDLTSSVSIKDLIESLKIDLPGFEAQNSQISISGELSFKKEKLYPDINVKIEPNFRYAIKDIITFSNLSAKIQRDTLSLTTETKALEGVVFSQSIISYNLDSLHKGLDSIKNVEKTIRIKDVKIKKHHVDSFLNPPKIQTQKVKASKINKDEQEEESLLFFIPLVNGQALVVVDNSFLGASKIAGLLKMHSKKDSIIMDKSRLIVDDGSLTFSGNAKRSSKIMNIHFSGNINNVRADAFSIFLPKHVGAVEGLFRGSLSGSIQQSKKSINYNAHVKFSAKDGRIEKMDLSPQLKVLIASLPVKLKKKIRDKSITVDSGFKKFFLDARFKTNEYAFNDIRLVGPKGKRNIRGSGRIYPLGKKEGEMIFHYQDGSDKLDNLFKDTGKKALPLRLAGTGLTLSVDKSYTVKQLTQGYAKNKGKSKVKKAVEKTLKKVLKNKGGKKLKGLLDGLF